MFIVTITEQDILSAPPEMVIDTRYQIVGVLTIIFFYIVVPAVLLTLLNKIILHFRRK